MGSSLKDNFSFQERKMLRDVKKSRKLMTKLKMGEASEDVHECVRCLRAIMNHRVKHVLKFKLIEKINKLIFKNKFGIDIVIDHRDAINSLALCLKHRDYRTKSFVLELLSAVSLLDNGVVLRAFDNFKIVHKEMYRFETLMKYFRTDPSEKDFNIDFTVTCMQFFNAISNSEENRNFRVHLQYEFTQLGLDDYLENKLCSNECERLRKHIKIYKDNQLDVHQLVEDSDAKNDALAENARLKKELTMEKNKFNQSQDQALNKMSGLQSDLCQMKQRLEILTKEKDEINFTLENLKRSTELQLEEQQKMFENKLKNFELLMKEKAANEKTISETNSSSDPHSLPSKELLPAPPEAPAPPPPPFDAPPPPPPPFGAPPPPFDVPPPPPPPFGAPPAPPPPFGAPPPPPPPFGEQPPPFGAPPPPPFGGPPPPFGGPPPPFGGPAPPPPFGAPKKPAAGSEPPLPSKKL